MSENFERYCIIEYDNGYTVTNYDNRLTLDENIQKFIEYDYFEEEEAESVTVKIGLENWSSDQIAQVAESELENANYHNFVNLPVDFLEEISKVVSDEEILKKMIVALVDSLFKNI